MLVLPELASYFLMEEADIGQPMMVTAALCDSTFCHGGHLSASVTQKQSMTAACVDGFGEKQSQTEKRLVFGKDDLHDV